MPARSEPGAVNMADAYARVSGGLGVAVTSTGTAAGNACGAMVEALTAGTPVVHLTGQIEVPYLDRDLGYIHEAPEQLDMLRAVSKAAFRVRSAETALGTLREAVRVALTAPRGPVSVEIPIDIQATEIEIPASLAPAVAPVPQPGASELDALAERLARAKRPLLWLGGGARAAGAAVKRLVDLGFGVVTSVQGRGIVPEDHPLSLGAFNLYGPVEKFYGTCDAMLVVGSRLRSNETLKYKLKLPRPLYRIDADPQSQGRCYADDFFVAADSAAALAALADRLQGRMKPDRRVRPRSRGDARGGREAGPRRPRAVRAPGRRAAARGRPRLRLGARRDGVEQHVGESQPADRRPARRRTRARRRDRPGDSDGHRCSNRGGNFRDCRRRRACGRRTQDPVPRR